MNIPDLPPVIDALGSILIVVVAGILTKLGLHRPDAGNRPPAANDAVVVSATFADGSVIRKLADAIAENTEVTGLLRNCVREGTEEQARTTAAVARLGDRVGRVVEVLDDRLPHARDLPRP